MPTYTLIKTLSNNVVLAKKDNREYILMGKGIGFGLKKQDEINNGFIERFFLAMNEDNLKQYEQLLQYISYDVVDVVEEVITMIKEEINEKLDERIHVNLVDHINFLITRLKEGINITNPFLKEISVLYKKEYYVAKKAVRLFEKYLNISIPEDEIGFIALHIYSAQTSESSADMLKYTRLCNECIEVLENYIGRSIDKESINYARMITHIRFAIQRLKLKEQSDNNLLKSIKEHLGKEYKIARQMANLLQESLDVKVSDDEVGYLAIHVNRLIKK